MHICPQESLFEGVTQNTSIVIGVKGSKANSVLYLYSNEIVSEIDATTISEMLKSEFSIEELVEEALTLVPILVADREK